MQTPLDDQDSGLDNSKPCTGAVNAASSIPCTFAYGSLRGSTPPCSDTLAEGEGRGGEGNFGICII